MTGQERKAQKGGQGMRRLGVLLLAAGTLALAPALPGTLARAQATLDARLSTANQTATQARVEGPQALDDGLRRALENSSLVITALAVADPAPTAQDVMAAARAEYANLLGVLYDRGYYGPEIHVLVDGREVAALSPFSVPARIGQVVIRVDPGPRFTFGRAEVGPLTPATLLPEGFAPGEVAGAALLREATGAAVEGWRAEGHAKARAGARSITARHAQAKLDAQVQIEPGPRLAFGRLIVAGNEKVRAERIRAIAGLRSGRVFDPHELELVARRLRKTGAFSSVTLTEADAPGADGQLDITATVFEAPPRRFGFGAEISSSAGGSLTAYWMHRNLLGGAERLRFDAAIEGIGADTGSFVGDNGLDYALSASLTQPGFLAAANTLTWSLGLEELDEPRFRSRTASGGVALSRELSDRVEITAGILFRFSDVEDGLGKRQMRHVLFPMTGQLDARDDIDNPTAGGFLRLELQPFAGVSGSESGARFYADGRYFHSFGADARVVLAGRVQAGAVAGASLTGTPPDFLFYSGGGGTVRGQPYHSLHVTSGGVELGGRSFLGASLEARVKAWRALSVVGFADWAEISADARLQAPQSHAGAGLGLRYDTPVGPIRLDVAAPVSGTMGKGAQLYLGIGHAF